MLTAYIFCLGFSGVLLAASVIGGSKDQDGAGDGGHDHDHDHDHDAGSDDAAGHAHDLHSGHEDALHAAGSHVVGSDGIGTALRATLLSIRFWTFASAAFGLTGALLTVQDFDPALTSALAVFMGLLCGSGVSAVMWYLRRAQASGTVKMDGLAGRDAEIVLSVGPDKIGKVRLTHMDQIIELPARTSEATLMDRREKVLIVEVRDGIAEITSTRPQRPPRQPVAE